MSGSITQQCCPKEPCNTAVALMAASPAWCTSSHMPTLVCYGAQAQGSTSILRHGRALTLLSCCSASRLPWTCDQIRQDPGARWTNLLLLITGVGLIADLANIGRGRQPVS